MAKYIDYMDCVVESKIQTIPKKFCRFGQDLWLAKGKAFSVMLICVPFEHLSLFITAVLLKGRVFSFS